MKRNSFLILCALILSLGISAFAQNGAVTITGTPGTLTGSGNIKLNSDPRFLVFYNNDTGERVNISNGFQINSPDGAVWNSSALDTILPNLPDGDGGFINWLHKYYDQAWGFQSIGNGSPTPDTLGILGAGNPTSATKQLPIAFNDSAMALSIDLVNVELTNAGKHICIDTADANGELWTWKWVTRLLFDRFPTFTVTGATPDGANGQCFMLEWVLNQPPTVTSPVGASITGVYCSTFTVDFGAVDPEGDAITEFALVSGPGAINAATGVWAWNAATILDVGASITVGVQAKDAGSNSFGPTFNLTVVVTNAAPVITGTCPQLGGNFAAITGTGSWDLNATDDCALPGFTWTVASDGDATTTEAIDANGLLTFTAQNPGTYSVVVTVSDGLLTDDCVVNFTALSGSAYNVQIEKTHMTIQGGFETVSVSLPKGIGTALEGTGGIGGFNILIAYDNSAMSLQEVLEGSIYDSCGWEYFTFRFGADGNCSGGCPSGLVRVIGIAETNNGANHPVPNCVIPDGTTLFDLKFLVSNDRTLECQYAPVRFFWIDCGDNAISSADGNYLYVETEIFDFGTYDTLTFLPLPGWGPFPDAIATLPGYAGINGILCDINEQLSTNPIKWSPLGEVSFFNGGIDIACADSIDARGDINLNGFAYEIADAVLFSRYFVYGLPVFNIMPAGQIAASDANADGLVLTVADLVYLIRVVVGDAQPYDKLSPVTATYVNDNGTLSVDAEMGAALVVVKGNVVPENLTASEMLYNFDGTNTRILVYPNVNSFSSFTGDFLSVNGEVVSVEFGSAAGATVVAKQIPANFALNQNYPNPFNPSTVISFALPKASDYTLTVYNVTGQKVAEFSGAAEAGVKEIEWNATANASGIYFYKLNAGSFSSTKKMVLIK